MIKKELPVIQENTTAKELAILIKANPQNKDICKQVARHPNTSPEILKELFKKYPADVLNNPIIDLLLLENPNLFDELYETNPNCFNTKKDLPIFYLEWAANNFDNRIRESLADSLSTPTFILKKLASDNNNRVRALVAKNSNITEEIIDQLLKDKYDLVLCNLARNKKTSHPILELLAKHKSIDVRRAVAENTNIPDYLLEKLSKDEDLAVVLNVAGNENTPDYLLEKLSEDEDFRVVLKVARNLSTPLEVLEKLSKHQNIYIRHSVFENCYVSLNIMKQLIKDREKLVKDFSAKLFLLKKLAEKIKYRDNLILMAKAINANIRLTLTKNLLTSDREQNQLNSSEMNFLKNISKHINIEKKRSEWSTRMENNYLLKTYGKKSRLELTDLELIKLWKYLADLSITNLDL